MEQYYSIELQQSDFCRVSDVLSKQPLSTTLNIDQRNNLTTLIISSNIHCIGKLWSNAATFSSILFQNDDCLLRVLPHPLNILMTRVATEDKSGKVHTYLLENPNPKNQTQVFPK